MPLRCLNRSSFQNRRLAQHDGSKTCDFSYHSWSSYPGCYRYNIWLDQIHRPEVFPFFFCQGHASYFRLSPTKLRRWLSLRPSSRKLVEQHHLPKVLSTRYQTNARKEPNILFNYSRSFQFRGLFSTVARVTICPAVMKLILPNVWVLNEMHLKINE